MYSLIVISSYAIGMVADGTAAIQGPAIDSGLPGAWTAGLPLFNKNEVTRVGCCFRALFFRFRFGNGVQAATR